MAHGIFHCDTQASHGDMQASHGAMQASHGDMQVSHGDMQASHGDMQASHGDMQAVLVVVHGHSCPLACAVLSSLTRDPTHIFCIARWTPKHCTAREVPAAAAKSLQSCLTPCDPTDSSPPGFAIPGILQGSP